MLKIGEVKVGDIVDAQFEDVVNTGEVIQVDHEERKALVSHGDQEFWYDMENLGPVILTLDGLEKMGFFESTDPLIKGTGIAYVKGPFILQLPEPDNLRHVNLTYRDEHRHIMDGLFLHELQNHYRSMTNIDLHLD